MRLGLTKSITLRVGTVPFGRERPVIYIYIYFFFTVYYVHVRFVILFNINSDT